MSEQNLIQAARIYNPIIAEFVVAHNNQHELGAPLHIYDLSKQKEWRLLSDQGYGVITVPKDGLRDLSNLYDKEHIWVDGVLRNGGVEYKTLEKSIKDNEGLSQLVGLCLVQRGLCVVRGNTSDHEFEVHSQGKEVLIPHFFNAITLITKGYGRKENTIDRTTARLVYIPVSDEWAYIFDEQTGHYAPHVLAVMEVVLPDGTGDDNLTTAEIIANQGEKRFVKRNTILASDREADKTTVKVVGESKATNIIINFNEIMQNKVGHDLEKLLK